MIAASQGGCKHGLAVLAWIHRKSESKSVTDVEPYWKKSRLSGVGTTYKYIETQSLAPKHLLKSKTYLSRNRKTVPYGSFLKEEADWLQDSDNKSILQEPLVLLVHLTEELKWYENVDIHSLAMMYRMQGKTDADGFFAFCK